MGEVHVRREGTKPWKARQAAGLLLLYSETVQSTSSIFSSFFPECFSRNCDSSYVSVNLYYTYLISSGSFPKGLSPPFFFHLPFVIS